MLIRKFVFKMLIYTLNVDIIFYHSEISCFVFQRELINNIIEVSIEELVYGPEVWLAINTSIYSLRLMILENLFGGGTIITS